MKNKIASTGHSPLRVGVIGLGARGTDDYCPALAASQAYRLVGLCDGRTNVATELSARYRVPAFSSVDDLLASEPLDVAVVSVPHRESGAIIEMLARQGISVIKTKPLATSLDEAMRFIRLAADNGVVLGVALQRRFHPVYRACAQLSRHVGTVFSIEARYTGQAPQGSQNGWIAREACDGGVLTNMGYDIVDLLIWYFGLPTHVTARLTRGNHDRAANCASDTAHLSFCYEDGRPQGEKVVGTAIISRAYHRTEERLQIEGSRGTIHLEEHAVSWHATDGTVIERLERTGGWSSVLVNQLDYFADQIHARNGAHVDDLYEHLMHLAVIEAALESDRAGVPVAPRDLLMQLERA